MEPQVITTAEGFFNQHKKDKLRVEVNHVHLKGEKDKILIISEVDSQCKVIQRLTCSQIENVEFRGLYFETVRFCNCEFQNVKFRDCKFYSSVFDYNRFDRVEFIGCRFDSTTFVYNQLSDSNFINCVFSRFLTRFFCCHILAYFKTITLFKNCSITTKIHMEDCKLDSMLLNSYGIYLTSNQEDLKFIDAYRLGHSSRSDNQNPYLTIGPIGSRNDYVSYSPEINWVKCGCWKEDENNTYIGGSLEAFKERVLRVYPEEGTYHHDEYMAAIKIFETARQKFLWQAVAV